MTTPGPLTIVELDVPLDDWTGASFVLRAPTAPGGVAIIMGGLGKEEERANAKLFAASEDLALTLKTARSWIISHGRLDNQTVLGQIQDALIKAGVE